MSKAGDETAPEFLRRIKDFDSLAAYEAFVAANLLLGKATRRALFDLMAGKRNLRFINGRPFCVLVLHGVVYLIKVYAEACRYCDPEGTLPLVKNAFVAGTAIRATRKAQVKKWGPKLLPPSVKS